MIGLLIYVLVLCIVLALLYYVVNTLVPEPMRKFAMVVLVVIAGIALIYLIYSFGPAMGSMGPPMRR